MELFKLFGSLFVDTAKADESISGTDKKVEGLGKKFLSGVETAAKWGAGIVAAAGVGATALYGVATKAADAMDAIDKGSQKMGISTKAYQEWDYAMGQSGMSISTMQNGMKTLSNLMDGAASGTASAQETFAQLGVSIYDSSGAMKSQEEMMSESIMSLANMEEGADRTALAVDLFGKSGTELAPLLNEGADGVQALIDRSHELGLVVDDEAVSAGVTLGDTIDDVKDSFSMVVSKIGVELMPLIQSALDWVIANMPTIQTVVGTVFDGISTIVITVGSILQTVFSYIVIAASDASTMFNNVTTSLQEMKTWAENNKTTLELLAIAFATITAAIIAFNAAKIIKNALDLVETIQIYALIVAETAHTVACTIATVATTALSTAIAFLTSPVTLIIVAIGALIAVVILLVKNWDTVKTVASNVWESIKNTFSNVGSWFNTNVLQPIVNTFTSVFDKISAIFASIKDTISGVFGAIVDIVKTPLNSVITIINKFISGLNKMKIPDWVPIVGGNGINIPEIPLLAKGGTVLNSGKAIVGEAGAELIDLPRGAKVTPLTDGKGNALGNDQMSQLLTLILAELKALRSSLYDTIVSALTNGVQIDWSDRELARLVKKYA